MTIADKTELKKMLGDPGETLVSDSELDSAIAYGDSEVRRRVGFVPSADSPEYPTYVAAAMQFAFFLIENKFPAMALNAKAAFNVAVATCDSIIQRDTDVDPDSGTPLIEVGDYQTYPLNPDAVYRFATKTRGGAITPSYSDVALSGYWVL
jgi:hypothetical protein